MKLPEQHVQSQWAKAVIRELREVAEDVHRQRSRVFEDWIHIVLATLNAIPAHAASVAATGQMAEDTPETRDLWREMRNIYERRYFVNFKRALHHLLESAGTYEDVVGEIYSVFGFPARGLGQFFSPADASHLLAQIVNSHVPLAESVHQRLQAAIKQSEVAQAQLIAAGVAARDHLSLSQRIFFENVIPAALPHYIPVTVYDATCGSGALLLAAAKTVPPWMNDLGLIQYFGQDLDLTAVVMASINIRLHNLNGWAGEMQAAREALHTAGRAQTVDVPIRDLVTV